jgi:vanillate O-demethylase ferredoxin subunit
MNRQWLTLKVAAKRTEAIDICSFELADPAGGNLPPFSAGAHIDVEVRDGLIRQYSLCNHSAEHHRYLIAVLRDPATRGGCKGMHDDIKEGQSIRVSEPKNHFPLAAHAKRSLLLAGGIGITPVLCMAERLAHVGADFTMHYCTRSRERTAFYERIHQSEFKERVQFHFDSGPAEQRLDLANALKDKDGVHLYVCGPTGFMDWVLSTAKANGWPEEQVHREYFNAAPVDTSTDGSFAVKIASSGRVIPVPADKTVIRALSEAGIEVPTSCEQGVCGTCLTRVIEGEPDHRDMYLIDEERNKNDQFLPCCSRSKSPLLVLDL